MHQQYDLLFYSLYLQTDLRKDQIYFTITKIAYSLIEEK
jgi:hypothetical protein